MRDTTGKGRLSKAVDGKIRNCIFVLDLDVAEMRVPAGVRLVLRVI